MRGIQENRPSLLFFDDFVDQFEKRKQQQLENASNEPSFVDEVR